MYYWNYWWSMDRLHNSCLAYWRILVFRVVTRHISEQTHRWTGSHVWNFSPLSVCMSVIFVQVIVVAAHDAAAGQDVFYTYIYSIFSLGECTPQRFSGTSERYTCSLVSSTASRMCLRVGGWHSILRGHSSVLVDANAELVISKCSEER